MNDPTVEPVSKEEFTQRKNGRTIPIEDTDTTMENGADPNLSPVQIAVLGEYARLFELLAPNSWNHKFLRAQALRVIESPETLRLNSAADLLPLFTRT